MYHGKTRSFEYCVGWEGNGVLRSTRVHRRNVKKRENRNVPKVIFVRFYRGDIKNALKFILSVVCAISFFFFFYRPFVK